MRTWAQRRTISLEVPIQPRSRAAEEHLKLIRLRRRVWSAIALTTLAAIGGGIWFAFLATTDAASQNVLHTVSSYLHGNRSQRCNYYATSCTTLEQRVHNLSLPRRPSRA